MITTSVIVYIHEIFETGIYANNNNNLNILSLPCLLVPSTITLYNMYYKKCHLCLNAHLL